ncbi:unnamed protein product [Gongylonema pulchrum]|uniref:Inhibitor of growth protein n=1 Tax=Gongylonema pulchrum TaxID=637853 RepID=A0A183EIX9_9BILA|nr:unnamed protein product [Gongylonema pulchrum]
MALLSEHVLDNLSTLPRELAKNLQTIRELDIECQKKAAEVDQKLKGFVKSYRKMPKNAAVAFNKEIMAMFAEIDRLSNQKIALASDTYQLVDKHIRRLDNDSAKFEATLRQKYLSSAAVASAASTANSSTVAPYKSFMDVRPVMEMPVDPNEPTYCVCHQVSYGEMIMCDNKQCPVEWFHFQCVGLTESPKGKWYCERCSEQRRRKSAGAGSNK